MTIGFSANSGEVRKTEGHVGLGASYAHGKAIHFHPLLTLGLEPSAFSAKMTMIEIQPER